MSKAARRLTLEQAEWGRRHERRRSRSNDDDDESAALLVDASATTTILEQSASPVSVTAHVEAFGDMYSHCNETHNNNSRAQPSGSSSRHQPSSIPASYIESIESAFGPKVNLCRDVFQVPSSASDDELRLAYFRLGRAILTLESADGIAFTTIHNNNVTSLSKSKFQAISMAYEILRRPEWRKQYQTYGLQLAEADDDVTVRNAPKSDTLASSAAITTTATKTGPLTNKASILRTSKTKRQQQQRHNLRWNEHVEELIYTQDDDELYFKLGTAPPCSADRRRDPIPCAAAAAAAGKRSRNNQQPKVWLETQHLGETLNQLNQQDESSLVSSFLNDLEKGLDGLEASVDSFINFSWMNSVASNESRATSETSVLDNSFVDDKGGVNDSAITTERSNHSQQEALSAPGKIHIVPQSPPDRKSITDSSFFDVDSSQPAERLSLPAPNDIEPDPTPLHDSWQSVASPVAESWNGLSSSNVPSMSLVEAKEVERASHGKKPLMARADGQGNASSCDDIGDSNKSKDEANLFQKENDPFAEMFASLTKSYKVIRSEDQDCGEPFASTRGLLHDLENAENRMAAIDFLHVESGVGNGHTPNADKDDFVRLFTADPWKCIDAPRSNCQRGSKVPEAPTSTSHPSSYVVRPSASQMVDQSEENFSPFGDEPFQSESGGDLFDVRQPCNVSILPYDDCGITVSTVTLNETASAWSPSAIRISQPLCTNAGQAGVVGDKIDQQSCPSVRETPGIWNKSSAEFDSPALNRSRAIRVASSFATTDSDVLLLDDAASAISSLTGKPSVVSASMQSCPHLFAPPPEDARNKDRTKPEGFGHRATDGDDDFAARLMAFVGIVSEEIAKLGDSIPNIFGLAVASDKANGNALDVLLDKFK